MLVSARLRVSFCFGWTCRLCLENGPSRRYPRYILPNKGQRFAAVKSATKSFFAPVVFIRDIATLEIEDRKLYSLRTRTNSYTSWVDAVVHSFGVSNATTVSPPFFRASSMENSARLIKSVTISSLSYSCFGTASTIPALNVICVESHGGRNPDAARRNLSARFCAPASVVSGKINASDQDVYFTATSFCRTIGCSDRASCSKNRSSGDSPCCRKISAPRSICRIARASGVPCVRARSASVNKQLWYELRLSSPLRSSETPMRRTSERSRV